MLRGGVALVSTYRRAWRSVSDKAGNGREGTYVECTTGGLIGFLDPTERKGIFFSLHGGVDESCVGWYPRALSTL